MKITDFMASHFYLIIGTFFALIMGSLTIDALIH